MIPDGLLFLLIVLAGVGAALNWHATTPRQARLSWSLLYLVAGLCITAALVGLVRL